MKNLINLFVVLLCTTLFVSCTPDEGEEPFVDRFGETSYSPTLMRRDSLNNSVKLVEPRSQRNIAKIYLYQDYILLVESFEGIHVINNANPNAPANEHFIEVPGCMDISMRNGVLYADNATDLVAIDVTNLSSINLVSRLQNTFDAVLPPDTRQMPSYVTKRMEEGWIVIRWDKK